MCEVYGHDHPIEKAGLHLSHSHLLKDKDIKRTPCEALFGKGDKALVQSVLEAEMVLPLGKMRKPSQEANPGRQPVKYQIVLGSLPCSS